MRTTEMKRALVGAAIAAFAMNASAAHAATATATAKAKILAPLTIAAVAWGLTRTFPGGDPGGAAAPRGVPLVHLWFLYDLAIFYSLALGLRAGFPPSTSMRRASCTPSTT